jgi:hypothetical protein
VIKLAGLKHSSLRLEPLALALAAIVSLSACGGGGGAEPMSAVRTPSFEGIAVGEPNPSAQVDKDVFIKMAQGAACSDKLNRLYIIDNAQVFWDVAGSCADASYSYALFGATPELKRCSAGDSIAGPRTSCADERNRETFDTIVKNRDKADLGLGSSHKIEVVDLTPQVKLGDTVPFEQLLVNQFSGNSDVKNVVVRDAKEWCCGGKLTPISLTCRPSRLSTSTKKWCWRYSPAAAAAVPVSASCARRCSTVCCTWNMRCRRPRGRMSPASLS